jgi:hypothetical protein
LTGTVSAIPLILFTKRCKQVGQAAAGFSVDWIVARSEIVLVRAPTATVRKVLAALWGCCGVSVLVGQASNGLSREDVVEVLKVDVAYYVPGIAHVLVAMGHSAVRVHREEVTDAVP